MQIVIHRVNTIEYLEKVPTEYGVEIDVRGYGDKLLLNHDPIDDPAKYEELEAFLKVYKHKLIVFNMKEAGYEDRVIALATKYNISEYFLLDVEFPYLYRATRSEGVRDIAVRFSEAEPIESVEAQIKNGIPLLDWVWIDTNTQLPINNQNYKLLKKFKTCLVCPERWGRPEDISNYREFMKKNCIKVDAVMTSLTCATQWRT